MKLPTYEKDWDLLAKKDPRAIREFYPRRIVCPHGYIDPKYYALVCWAACAGVKLGPETNNKVHNVNAVNQFMNLDCPTYFVAPEFAMAINATKPPDDMRIQDIHFPMNSMLLVFPLEFIQATYKWMIPFVLVSHLPKGVSKVNPAVAFHTGLREGSMGCEAEMFSIHCPFFPEDGMGISYGAWYPADFSIAEVAGHSILNWNDDMAIQKDWVQRHRPEMMNMFDHKSPVPTGDEDKSIPNKFTLLSLKIILALSARPHLLTLGGMTRTEKVRDGHVIRDALWAPHIIGRDYRINRAARESLGGTHASPRVHWRMGHWHTVLHGKGRALRRVDWFEPVLVNAAPEQDKT
jgi:hypothetical protein